MSLPISAGQAAASPAQAPIDGVCAQPVTDDAVGPNTLSNVLRSADVLPDPVRLESGGSVESYLLRLDTRLRPTEGDLEQISSFKVLTELVASDGRVMPNDAFVVAATPASMRRIGVSVCIDPTPASGALDAGVYTANIGFVDRRIPEINLTFDVWVGGATSYSYSAFVVTVGAVLLLALPLALAGLAKLRGHNAREELGQAGPWMLPLMVLGALGYLWATVTFPRTDQFRIWSSSDGIQQFVGFAFGKIATAVTASLAMLSLIPRLREALAKVLVPAAAPAGPEGSLERPPLGTEPREDASPSGRDPDGGTSDAHEPIPPPPIAPAATGKPVAGVRWWPPPWPAVAVLCLLAVVLFAGGLLAGRFVVTGPPEASSAEIDDDTVAPPSSSVAPGSSTTIRSTTVPAGQDDFFGVTPGVTAGSDAYDLLRAEPFTVFTYQQCSDTVSEGLVMAVYLTEPQRRLIDPGGSTELADGVAPPATLDLYVSNGPC